MRHAPFSRRRAAAALACAAALALSAGCAAPGQSQSAAEPVAITVWTYYNGEQLEAFNALVAEFNETVGQEWRAPARAA